MTSSERRWASTRKSGMTVLGKVPKPINLPSQKLENHGLDPNVDLVPKGTHTWGSRPSNASNAWATSSSSPPQSDGCVSSPNNTYGWPSSTGNAYGRPSSGGSSTRPSTAGSERSSEAVAIALGSNSRPSSASGILPSSQISLSLNRPRSAETKPGSSHLSRFSENSSDCNVWLSAGTSERLGVVASKRSDFSLNSGDFPSLGSEKISEPKSLDQKGHGNISCKEDTQAHAGHNVPTNMENLQKDHPIAQPQLNSNIPPQQYGSWYVHPVHPPDRFSCRGNEAGGFYRPVVPPASYPIDLYYPCAPVRAMPTQVLARPDGSSMGHHPVVGKPSRYLPDACVAHGQSVISATPGVHPGPALYEAYYGPPASYGVTGQERLCSQYPFQNPGLELGTFHATPDRNPSTIIESQILVGQAHGNHEKSKVLLKQQDREIDKGTLVGQLVVAQSGPQRGRPGSLMMEKSLPGDAHEQEQISSKQFGEFSGSQLVDIVEDPSIIYLSASLKTADQCVVHRHDDAVIPVNDVKQNPVGESTASLMEKVESLNGKTRIANVQTGVGNLPSKDIKINRNASNGSELVKKVDLKSSCSSNVHLISSNSNLNASHMNTSLGYNVHVSTSESDPTHGQSEQAVTPGKLNSSKTGEHSQSHHRNRVHNLKERIDETNKVPDSSMEKTSVAVGVIVSPSLHCTGSEDVQEGKICDLKIEVGNETDSPSSLDSVDLEVQRSKLKEQARQRSLQLQREEEERMREQKAKALAKLEELNMRTTSASSKQNSALAKPCCTTDLNEKDVTSDIIAVAAASVEPSSSDSDTLLLNNTSKTMDSSFWPSETMDSGLPDTVSRPDQVSFGEMQKFSEERSEPDITLDISRRPQCVIEKPSSGVSSVSSENHPPVQPKKKNNRGLKFKYKNDIQQNPSSPSSTTHLGKGDAEHASEVDGAKLLTTVAEEAAPVSEKSSLKAMESHVSKDVSTVPSNEPDSRPAKEASSLRISHPPKKQGRNLNPNKTNAKYHGNETAVWAPVKALNKNGPSESVDPSPEKTNLDTHNGAKVKRAEMERYVPKPISKELSRDSHAPPPLLDSGGATGSDPNSAVTASVFISSTRNAESTKQNRRGKPHTSWRQRNSGEPPSNESSSNQPTAVENNNLSFSEAQKGFERASSAESGRMVQEGTATTCAVVKDHGLNRRIVNQNFVADHVKSQWQPKSRAGNGGRGAAVKESCDDVSELKEEEEVEELNREVKAAYVGKPISRYNYQKSASYDKPRQTMQSNSSAADAVAEAHRPFSETRYGHQGRGQHRHGGAHFHGPRRNSPIHTSGE